MAGILNIESHWRIFYLIIIELNLWKGTQNT